MKKSHYETLGVDTKADATEIKRVYRRKAADAHPDKGGDHGETAQLNYAYEVLSDPARRLLYDKTGKDVDTPMVDKVRAVVMDAFLDGLTKNVPNIMAHAKKFLEDAKQKNLQQKRNLELAKNRLTERREKITTKGVNVFHLIIDQQLPQIEQNIAQADANLEVCNGALKELKRYKSAEELERQMQPTYVTFNQWAAL